MKPFAVLIPKGLDVEELVNIYSFSLDADYIKYLIYYVLKKLAFHIETKNHTTTPIFERHIPIGKSVYHARHDKFKKHIDFLCANNIEVRQSRSTKRKISVFYRKKYKKGKTPFRYRLSYKFNRKPLTVQFINDPKLINKIRTTETKIPTVIKRTKYKFFRKYFSNISNQSTSLQIDLDKAVQLCDSRYKQHESYSKYLNELNQIIDLYNGLYRVYYNENTDGRIHSNITRLPKVYRKFISYNNQSLVEVDLSNSIIYFLAILLSKSIKEDIIIKYPTLLMICKYFKSVAIKEVEEVHRLATNGSFYDSFISEFEKKYSLEVFKKYYEDENKEEYLANYQHKKRVVKKRLLAMLFANTNQYSKEQHIFKSKFPELLKNINAFKIENGYQKFSHALFQLEAYCLIDKTARKFNRENHRKAPVFTLHDCLITTLNHKKALWSIMNESLSKLLGSAPMMKIKSW